MRLPARIARLERARPQLTEAERHAALMRELDNDPPAREAMRDLGPAFWGIDPSPGYLDKVLAVIQADPAMSASLIVYVEGLQAARARLAARGLA